MQQPKIFYPQQETYAPRPLERPDGQPNRPFSAFILPENLASVGTPSLYHCPNQEKELFAAPPAGFHMAPCGCFFDPRIYRIEWAAANFVQPSVYKLSGGPGPQNTYLLDSQKYLKGPLQSVPYQPYQPVTSNPQFVLPFFKPEGPATGNSTDHVGFIGNPGHGSLFVDAARLPGEGPVPSGAHTLPPTVPGSNLKEPPSSQTPVAYECLTGPLHHCSDLAFQAFKGFLAEDGDLRQDFAENSPVRNVQPANQTALSVPRAEVTADAEPCTDLDSLLTEENTLLEEEEESFSLPDKVLLEDAMKLFDCSPVNSDTEASLDNSSNGSPRRHRGDSLRDGCFSGEDSSSDIRSLNLPDELLSFDYSVPEILSAVTSLDYLYDITAFGEDAQWESGRPASQPPPRHEHRSDLEKAESSSAAPKKTKPAAGKSSLASARGGDGGPREPEPALVVV
ncbi:proline-rich protein 22 [Elgaria multicarinata webbii]|uniref:proline-rich protein 22 n=1 Tax=Elgaria multicarinata webbii TaxID=159646 RepID=UPI002FCD5D6E